MRDDDGSNQIFLVRGPQSSRGHYFIYPLDRVQLENFLDHLFLYFLDNIPEIYNDNFFEVACETRKNM